MRNLLWLAGLTIFAAILSATDISGTWSADVALDAGSGTAIFVLTQTGDTLAGTYSGRLGDAKVAGSIKGDEVEWAFETDDAGKVTYKGKLEGTSKIKGAVEYGQLGKGTFSAEKQK